MSFISELVINSPPWVASQVLDEPVRNFYLEKVQNLKIIRMRSNQFMDNWYRGFGLEFLGFHRWIDGWMNVTFLSVCRRVETGHFINRKVKIVHLHCHHSYRFGVQERGRGSILCCSGDFDGILVVLLLL